MTADALAIEVIPTPLSVDEFVWVLQTTKPVHRRAMSYPVFSSRAEAVADFDDLKRILFHQLAAASLREELLRLADALDVHPCDEDGVAAELRELAGGVT